MHAINNQIDIVVLPQPRKVDVSALLRDIQGIGNVWLIHDKANPDNTQIALNMGVSIIDVMPWDHEELPPWGAISKLPLPSNWVLVLHSDLRVSQRLRNELLQVVSSNGGFNAYRIPETLIIMGKTLKHGSQRLRTITRLMRRESLFALHASASNGFAMVEGKTGRIRECIIRPWYGSISDYIHGLICMADLDSKRWIRRKQGFAMPEIILESAVDLQPPYWLWGKPILSFFGTLLRHGGILEGVAGWHLAMLHASRVYMTIMLYRQGISSDNPGRTGRQ